MGYIVTWIGIIVVIICGVALVIACANEAVDSYEIQDRIGWIIGAFVSAVIAIMIAFGLYWALYNTESGARAIKDWNSNINGGIERTVTVYDINGDIIAEYNGKFDVESNDTRIKFDDEDGKRHIIYFTTGTVTIDEN